MMKPRRKKALKIVIPILLILAWLSLEMGYASWRHSAICTKCLQHASIRRKKLFGLTIYKSVTLKAQRTGGLMSSVTFSPPVPKVSPDLYTTIMGENCDHLFKEGGFGKSRGFLILGVIGCGGSSMWQQYTLRINAIEALYMACDRTANKTASKRIYQLIDNTFPANDNGTIRATSYWLSKSLKTDSEEQIESEIKTWIHRGPASTDNGEAKAYRQMTFRLLDMHRMTIRLRQIKTAKQLNDLFDEYADKLDTKAIEEKKL